MTVIEDGLTAFLLATPSVTALVSDRIYGIKVKQNSLFPCITKQRITTPRVLTHDMLGASGVLAHPRFQLDTWGVAEDSVKAVADAVRAALNGFKGSLGGVTVQAVLIAEEMPEYDPETDIYRVRSEYIFWQEE